MRSLLSAAFLEVLPFLLGPLLGHSGDWTRARVSTRGLPKVVCNVAWGEHPTTNAVSKHERGRLKLRWRNDPVALSALWWATMRFVCLVDGSDGKDRQITMWNEGCLDIEGSRHGGSVEGFQGLRSDSR